MEQGSITKYLLVLGSSPPAVRDLRRVLAPRYPHMGILATVDPVAGLEFLSQHSREIELTVVDAGPGSGDTSETMRQVLARSPRGRAVVVTAPGEARAHEVER